MIELSESHSAVGRLLNQMGRPRQALGQHLDQALALLQPMRKSAAWSPHLHKALHEALDNRAEALTLMANGEQARAHYQEAFKVAESWLKSQPLAADARQRHLVATSRVANDMIGQGELAPAVERYQAIHQAVDELVRWDPSNEKWKRDLEATRILLAQGWTASGKYAEAHAHFDTALAGLTRQQALDRSSSDAQTDLGWLRSSRGALAKAEKIWGQAVTEYAASARHYAAAAAAAPNSASIGQSHYLALRELAIAQDGVGRHAEALATLHQGRDLVSALIKAAPEMTVAAFDLQTLLDDERDMLARQGKPGEGVALAAARRKALADALAAAPNNAELWNRVHIDEIDNGDQAAAAGKPSDAVAAYQRAIAKLQKAVAIDGRNAVLWSNLRNAWTRIAGVETKRKRIGAARLAYASAQAPCERAFELSSKPEDKAKYALRLHDDQLALGELEAGAGDKAAAIRSFALARDWIGKAGVAMPAVSAHADSLAEVQRRLAVAAAAQGDKASAAAARRAAGEAAEKAVAVAARHESADDQGLRLAALQQQYADTAEEQIKQGEAAAAVDSLKAGIAALGRSAAALPKSSAPQRAQQQMQARLAELLEEGGDQDAGLAQRRASVETALQAAALDGTADDFFTVAQRQFELGRHFVGRESWGDALAGFRQGVAFSAKAIALDASNGRHQMAMAYCQRGIGEMLARTGQDAASRTAYEAAVAAGEHAVALSPDGAAYWQVLVMAQRSLAVHLDHLGRPQAALAAYGAALKTAERAASRKDPYDGAAAEVQELRELITKRSAAGT